MPRMLTGLFMSTWPRTQVPHCIVGSTTVGQRVVRYRRSLLMRKLHLGVMIMLSSQGCDAQAHISAFSRNARLIGMTIKRLPAALTPIAAFMAHFLFDALPSVRRTMTLRRVDPPPVAVSNNLLASVRPLPVIVPPLGHLIFLMFASSASLSFVTAETRVARKEYKTTPNLRPSPICSNSLSFATLDCATILAMKSCIMMKLRAQCLRPRFLYRIEPLPSRTNTTSKFATHSMVLGHGFVLQNCFSQRSGVRSFQHCPAPIVGVAILLVRVCIPGLQLAFARQDFVHAPQAVQSERTQSVSQLCVLQESDSELAGHFLPPYSSGVSTLRDCDSLPPPH